VSPISNKQQGAGKKDVIRKRTPEKRLAFIFSALMWPPTGLPTHDDVLDVLCRVQYPVHVAAKGQKMRRPVAELASLAERLLPEMERAMGDNLPGETLEQVEKLIAAFLSRYERLVVSTDVEN
jgi:hypothetical protein